MGLEGRPGALMLPRHDGRQANDIMMGSWEHPWISVPPVLMASGWGAPWTRMPSS